MAPPAPARKRSVVFAPDERRPSPVSTAPPAVQRTDVSPKRTAGGSSTSNNREAHIASPPVTPVRAGPQWQTYAGAPDARSSTDAVPRTLLRQASRMEPLVEAHQAAIAAAKKAKKSPAAPQPPAPAPATSSTLQRSASRTPRTSPHLLSDPPTSLERILPSSSPPTHTPPQRKPLPPRASTTRRRTTGVQALPPGSALRDASLGSGGPGVLALTEDDAALLSSSPLRPAGACSTPRIPVHGRLPPPRPLKMSPEPRLALQPRTNSGRLEVSRGGAPSPGQHVHKRLRYDESDDIVDDAGAVAGEGFKKQKLPLARHEDVFGPAPGPVPVLHARDQRVMRRDGTPQGSGSRADARVLNMEVPSELYASGSLDVARPQEQEQELEEAEEEQQQQEHQQEQEQQEQEQQRNTAAPAPHSPKAPMSSQVEMIFQPQWKRYFAPTCLGFVDAPRSSSAPPAAGEAQPQQHPLAVSSSSPAALEQDAAAHPPAPLEENHPRELDSGPSKSPSPDPGLYAPPSETAVLRRVMSYGVPPAPPASPHLPAAAEPATMPATSPGERRSLSSVPAAPVLNTPERLVAARLQECREATYESAERVLWHFIARMSSNLPGMPPADRVQPTSEGVDSARLAAAFLGNDQAVYALEECLEALADGDLRHDQIEWLRDIVHV